jgi:hypothetical protein
MDGAIEHEDGEKQEKNAAVLKEIIQVRAPVGNAGQKKKRHEQQKTGRQQDEADQGVPDDLLFCKKLLKIFDVHSELLEYGNTGTPDPPAMVK